MAAPYLVIDRVMPVAPGMYAARLDTSASLQPAKPVDLGVGRDAGHALMREMARLEDEDSGGRLVILDAQKVRNTTVWAVIVGHRYPDGVVLNGTGGLALFIDERVPGTNIKDMPDMLTKFLG